MNYIVLVNLIVLSIYLFGCAHNPSYSPPSCKIQASKLSVGMTKQEVLTIMAREPDRFSAIRNIEVIHFVCDGPNYIIRFVDGKVDAYGKEGDFDLTKEPGINVNIKNK
jgi:hypothetical protein